MTMRFSVDDPDPTDARVRAFEDGPTYPCWKGDEECSFRPGGSCLLIVCTCESYGHCDACPPSDWQTK